MDGEDGSQDTSAEIDPEIQKITDQLNSRAWNQGTQQQPPFSSEISGEPVQAGMTPEEFAAAPALDPHNDDEAWQALIPESPELPWWQDSSHENHTSNLGKLMRVMAAAGIGALAGRGGQEALIAQSHGMRSGGIGTGFSYGAQAVQNLQNLALQRQEMADKSAYQQAQTGMLQARTSISGVPRFPLEAAHGSSWIDGRTDAENRGRSEAGSCGQISTRLQRC
jgi:hypothetical protein